MLTKNQKANTNYICKVHPPRLLEPLSEPLVYLQYINDVYVCESIYVVTPKDLRVSIADTACPVLCFRWLLNC